MNEFFSEETLKHPPSLPKCGQIRSGNKSDLIGCIEEVLNVLPRTEAPAVEAAVLEGSVVVNMVNVKKNQSFQTYASDEFKNHVTKYEREYHPDRIDIKFDTYQQLTLKMATRTKRGKGVRRRLQDDLIAPTNCHSFLRLDENKIELFCYLSQYLVQKHGQSNIQLVFNFDTMSISYDPDADLSFVLPCNHKEADTRVFLHTKDMALKGNKSILIRTVDIDVLALSLASFFHLAKDIDQFWIDFGTGKSRKFFAIHEICDVLRTEKGLSIPFFHAFTGCDQCLEGLTRLFQFFKN